MSEPTHKVTLTNPTDSDGFLTPILLFLIWWQLDNIADALVKIAAKMAP